MRLAVFASGGGSNFAAMLTAIDEGRLAAEPVLLVADRPGIGAIEKAETRGVPVAVVPPSEFADEEGFAEALLTVLGEHEAEIVALAGYLKKVPVPVVRAYRQRMLNIHPALLPSFGGHGMFGLRVHEAVLAYGCRVTGATVHLVDEEYDTGPILLQGCVSVMADDTPRTLAARVLLMEHQLYPDALQLFAEDRVVFDGRRVLIRDA